jgi:hypothetical protein
VSLFDLDNPILDFGANAQNRYWTIRNAVEGVQIFGGIGSGKTSGSGRMLALKYLKAGFGGLVLTVKPDEKDMWVEYCELSGRSDDLLIIEPKGQNHFNFLDYESSQASGENAITENLVQVLKTVIRAGEEKDSGKSDDAFWETALDMLIFNVIDLCKLAYGTVSIERIYHIVQTTLKEGQSLKYEEELDKQKAFQKAITLAHVKILSEIDEWEKTLTQDEIDFYNEHPLIYEEKIGEVIPAARIFRFLDEFFMDSFKNLSEKTRSIIDFSFSGFLFRLLRDPVYSLFCRYPSTITPDDSLKGKIILLNLPVKVYHKVGRDCQILFKYIWQRRMEQRSISENDRPVFLFADEAHNFLHEHDADFQATARSSRVATVYISQNLPNYYASMGGEKSKFKVSSFLGTLNTKIFHANADIETNEFASKLLGDAYFLDKTKNVTVGGKDFSQGNSESYKLERIVRPEEFISFKTGGKLNNCRVEGILHRQGDIIINDQSFKKMSFNQEYK